MDALIGTVLEGRYEILAHLGSGGMGTVYRARQLAVGRDVAVKVIHAGAQESDAAVRRFETEAQVIAQLRHPNTLTLFDVGRTGDGVVYIVTELLRGEPLDAALASGPLTIDQTLSIVARVADAIGEAHDRGIIHRDLKPGNVFLERVGSRELVRVLDFGIAKLLEGATLTDTGSVCGTAAYMSPEQATAEPLDGRSDIYSLGVIAYECLSGNVPFEADTPVSLLFKHVHEPPPPLRDAGASFVPPGVESLVLRMLAKDPTDRPASAAALVEEVAGLRQSLRDAPSAGGGATPSAEATGGSVAGDATVDPLAMTHTSAGALPLVRRPDLRPFGAALLLVAGVAAAGWLLLRAPTVEVEPLGSRETLRTTAATPSGAPTPSPAVDAGRASPSVAGRDAGASTPTAKPGAERRRRRPERGRGRRAASTPSPGPERAPPDSGRTRAAAASPPADGQPAGDDAEEPQVLIKAPPGFVDVPFLDGE